MEQGVGQVKIGDRLTFKSATRDSCRKATRPITGFDSFGRPLVNYASWRGFIVMPHEIISIEESE